MIHMIRLKLDELVQLKYVTEWKSPKCNSLLKAYRYGAGGGGGCVSGGGGGGLGGGGGCGGSARVGVVMINSGQRW